MWASPCFCLLVLMCMSALGDARNPGFKARVTQNALNYANRVAVDTLKENVMSVKIPDMSGKASGFKYWVRDIRVTKFDPPASCITPVPGKGLNWKANNAYIGVSGGFRYKKWFVSDSGSFDAKVQGVSFDLSINIGKDGNGRPSISTDSCSASISKVDFKFKGGMAWLYNLFRGTVGDKIKDSLKGQLCDIIKKAVNEDGEKKLASLPVTTTLDKKFLLDYQLTQAPAFLTSYLETYHKGEIYWLTNPGEESPMTPPPMPNTAGHQKMLYLWLSDYIFDTAGYVAQKNNYLKSNVSADDLPPEDRGVLNTTCDGFIPKCVGALIPQIGEKYPNMLVDMDMRSTKAPDFKITPGGIKLECAGTIDLMARKPGGSVQAFLVSLDTTMSADVDISLHNELLYSKVKNININLKTKKSAVGPISDSFLDFLVKEALDVYLIPTINEVGEKGFPLPVTDEFKFTNTELVLMQDTVLISTDLLYTKDANQPKQSYQPPVTPTPPPNDPKFLTFNSKIYLAPENSANQEPENNVCDALLFVPKAETKTSKIPQQLKPVITPDQRLKFVRHGKINKFREMNFLP